MKAVLVALVLATGILGSALFGAATAHALDGDVNGDCTVNTIDLYLTSARYGAAQGSLRYSSQYDLNGDRQIDVKDLQMVAARFGSTC